MSNTRSTAPVRGAAVETTASFPNPAQDYFTGHLSLDRHLVRRPTSTLVVVVDAERRLGRFDVIDGQAVLATDLEQIPLTADVEPWGVATVLLHHLPLGPAGDRERRNVAR